ncbi:MAG: hypothetical protein M5U30_14725 [Burkholderiaceae bacterium]|nr:hypothetical protein [Burkholderiaceae bacterium]
MTRLPVLPPSPHRRRLLVAAAGLLPIGCAAPQFVAPPPGPIATPQVRLGQRWRYETIDLYRGAKVGELNAEVVRAGPPSEPGSVGDTPEGAPIVVTLADANGAAAGEERWARPWDVIVEPAYDAVQTFTRPMPLLPDRLEAGARRSDATWYRVPQASGRLPWRQWLTATGWERVRVPAGEFVALRVERVIDFRHVDTLARVAAALRHDLVCARRAPLGAARVDRRVSLARRAAPGRRVRRPGALAADRLAPGLSNAA